MREDLDLHRLLGALHQSRTVLQLDTAHLCYLIVLRARVQRDSLASLDEDTLIDLYLQVCELIDPEAPNPRKRATHAIQHLREQRLLRRVDGAGVARAGEFTPTRLALAIVDFFVEDETLTKESLVVLTRALLSQVGTILADAKGSPTVEGWRLGIAESLRVAVTDLVTGIERRQRGMDWQQEEIRARIASLLQTDWFNAVDECERLLEDTSATLSELNEILMRDTVQLQAMLHEIEQLAIGAEEHEASRQADAVQLHLDRVVAWGIDRQKSWSTYYQYAQRHLRDVVRLDPDRAISQRLRDQLASWLDRPFAHLVADEERIRLLRDDIGRVERPPVTRAHEDYEVAAEVVPTDPSQLALEDVVAGCLNDGIDRLTVIVASIAPSLPTADRYRTMGRIAELTAAATDILPAIERDWVDVPSAAATMEEWLLSRRLR